MLLASLEPVAPVAQPWTPGTQSKTRAPVVWQS